jgi:hypothetical protein
MQLKMKRNMSYPVLVFLTVCLFGTILPAWVIETEEKAAGFDAQGALMLPEGYRTWVYIGGSVTPNEMNDGKAAFPEFHNTYMDPKSFHAYKKTGRFPEGTVFIKETVNIGSKQSLSGNGYFMGTFVGLFAMVKDSKHFPNEPENWAFFTFKSTADKPPVKKTKAHPTASCSSCHAAGAEERVFTQYYPVLKAAKPE